MCLCTAGMHLDDELGLRIRGGWNREEKEGSGVHYELCTNSDDISDIVYDFMIYCV